MTAVVVRPRVPELGDLKVVPDPRPGLERTRLVIDREAGTATWTSGGDEPLELRLGDGRGQLAGLVRAVYPPAMPGGLQTVLAGRVLLVDGEGRVLARSPLLTQVLFDQAWPLSLLESSGLPAREARFRNTRVLQAAHQGAAPLWPLTAGFLWFIGSVLLALLLVVALVAAVVVLTG